MLGFLILYLKGMRIMMFQLSGFYCKRFLWWYMCYGDLSIPIQLLTIPP